MASVKEQQLAYRAAIVLLVIGVLCYAAFPARTPELPARVMLKNMAGKVLFDHKSHASVQEYGLACIDCHHTSEADESSPEACRDCHKSENLETDGTLVIKRQEAFHQQCETCHKDYDIGPSREDERCSWCHLL